MATKTEDLTELSNIISTSVKSYLSNIPTPPTLRPAPPVSLTNEVADEAREQLLLACRKVISLIEGPIETVLGIATAVHETTALKLAYDMKLAHNVPLDGSPISLAELATKTGASEDIIVRVMRALTFKYMFTETAPGYFAHTGASAAIGIPGSEVLVAHFINEGFTSAPHTSDVLRENNFVVPQDGRKSAFTRAFNTNKNFFEYAYSDDKPMGTLFGQNMRALSSSRGPFSFLELYEPVFSSPGCKTLVDIGGGIGHVSIAAAQKFPNLKKCVVQDMGMVVGEGRDGLPEELKGRVEFQENNFFKAQPISGPRVYYYLKYIMNDHPDRVCKEILSHIASAMDSSSRILIDEYILYERLGPEANRLAIAIDIHVLVVLNSKGRTETQFAALLKSADERLVIEKVWRPKGGGPGIIEVRLA